MLERYRKDLPFAALYRGKDLDVSFGIDDAARRPWPLGGEQELVRVGDAAVLKIATPGREPYGTLVAGINPQRGFDAAYADFFRLVSANIAGAIAAVQALEDERRRAEALAELDRAKTAFFSNVSHEFRTPLTLMLGPLEDAAGAEILRRRPARSSRSSHRNGQRLLKLVNTLLDFSRIEAGRAQAAYEPTDLAALTADLASNFRSACERAGLRARGRLPAAARSRPTSIREMWEKIVLNLLSNAFKFTFDGEIAVSLAATRDHFELDGARHRHRHSRPTSCRACSSASTASRTRAAAATRAAASASRWCRSWCSCTAARSRWRATLGKGTAFTVTIPKGRAHLPAERVKGAARDAGGGRLARRRVCRGGARLAAGGATRRSNRQRPGRACWSPTTTPTCASTRAACSPSSYEVEAVADGQAALAAARARPPHLVISDVMMPHLDGFGLLRELRADPALRALPVILLSARAGEEARVEGLGTAPTTTWSSRSARASCWCASARC